MPQIVLDACVTQPMYAAHSLTSLSTSVSKVETRLFCYCAQLFTHTMHSGLAVLYINSLYSSCNEALLMSFAHGLRTEFRFSNGL